MAHCIGSGVPSDWFEHGHQILPGTEQHMMFPSNPDKTGSRYFRRRCYRCDSTRRYWRRSTDATAKATKAHRSHARRLVKKGLAPDTETAVSVMVRSGLTVEWLAETALAAIGQPCPGRCFAGRIVNGEPFCDDHVITEWADLTLDWREPNQLLTRENVGWLCMGCNKQKQQKPWGEFMACQHAIRQNFLYADRLPWQLELWGACDD